MMSICIVLCSYVRQTSICILLYQLTSICTLLYEYHYMHSSICHWRCGLRIYRAIWPKCKVCKLLTATKQSFPSLAPRRRCLATCRHVAACEAYLAFLLERDGILRAEAKYRKGGDG